MGRGSADKDPVQACRAIPRILRDTGKWTKTRRRAASLRSTNSEAVRPPAVEAEGAQGRGPTGPPAVRA
eukprot:1245612-Alexandrium_andersonii.AAC.1